MSPETRYKIEEIEALTGLSRRLIYDYISRELVPPALGSGKGAYYLAEHYDRLRLISLLRTMGFRLERIEEALQSWSPEEISRIVEFAEGRDMESLEALNDWLTPPPVENLEVNLPAEGGPRRLRSDEALDQLRSVADFLESADPPAYSEAPKYSDMVPRARAALRRVEFSPEMTGEQDSPPQTWHRVHLTPDIEINYRTDIHDDERDRIAELIERAKELFNS